MTFSTHAAPVAPTLPPLPFGGTCVCVAAYWYAWQRAQALAAQASAARAGRPHFDPSWN